MSTNPTSGPVLDLPPRIRRLLITAFCIGLVLIAAGSLYKGKTTTIPKDKLVHFSAYTLLASVLILGLRLRLSLVCLTLLALTSYAIEFIQPYFGRSRDMFDAWANTAGVCIGAGVGFALRLLASYLWTEFQEIRMNKHLKQFSKGSTLMKAGLEQKYFYMIKSGTAQALREIEGQQQQVAILSKGNCIGLVSDALDIAQEDTIVALEDMEVYVLDYETLLEESGGTEQPIAVVIKCLVQQLDQSQDRVEDIIEEDS